jgi:putative flippase GtrA
MLKKILNKETILYLIFGVLTTIINILTFSIMERLTTNLLFNNTIAWICSVLFAFITNRNIVFQSTGNKLKELCLFFGARIASLLFDNALIFILIEKLMLNNILSKIIVNIFVVVINYILSKLIVFKKEKP